MTKGDRVIIERLIDRMNDLLEHYVDTSTRWEEGEKVVVYKAEAAVRAAEKRLGGRQRP